jgi:hypothetical protein
MHFVSEIIKNLESIPELRKIIKSRESFYTFLPNICETPKYKHLATPFGRHNVVTIYEAKDFLNYLLEQVVICTKKCNYITYEKKDVDIILEKINPKNICIINNSTVAFFSKCSPIQLKKQLGETSIKNITNNQIPLFFDLICFFVILTLLYFLFSYITLRFW